MLERFEVRSVEPVPGWAYEWVVAEAGYAVDPLDERNARIADLGLAPRDPDGLVRFHGDVTALRPTSGGNRRAVVSVCNRGSVTLPFTSAVESRGTTGIPHLADTLLLEQGWTIVWVGWQWDVDRAAGLAGLSVPQVEVEPGSLRCAFFVPVPTERVPLADANPMITFTAYPTSDLDDPDAVLTERTSQLGPARVIARDRWRFVSPGEVALDHSFQPFRWYELTYRSTMAPVVGTGLLAVRDLGAHLRHDHDHVFAYGISQTGRFLREYVFHGLNLDERSRQVFDGLFINVASARRGEFNRRYAQPSTMALMPEYGPPYDSTSLLARQRTVGGVPKIMITNGAYEYWRGDGALVHQDPATGQDLPEDPDVRTHLIAGTDHLGRQGSIKAQFPVVNPTHQLDPDPILRALFVQLADWACDGREPSPSQVPRRAEGTLAERADVLARFPAETIPDPDVLPYTPALDPEQRSWPLTLGAPRVALVSTVDDHGNEVAGIRLPELAAGAAAFTGWNPRRRIDGLPDVLYDMVGSRLPCLTRPTPPYATTVQKAARALVAERFVLQRDLDLVIARALEAASGSDDPP